jgi:predicted signal transduction protein with EAL and GGDEF domain
MFGMLQDRTQLATWGVSIVARAGDLIRYANNRDGEMLRIDALLCAVIALTFPWIVYIGERVKRLERGLTQATIELDDVEESSWRDELTSLYNRRAINVSLDEAKQRADATCEPLSLCVVDLDHFKRYNDELGHLAGRCGAAFAHSCRTGCAAPTSSGATAARSSSRSSQARTCAAR